MTCALTNTGTISVYSGTLEFADRVNDMSGNTLTEGTWNVYNGATLALDGYTININQADVTLSGANSQFPAINQLADNQGTFALLALRQFTTAGDLANEDTIALDAGSTLHVTGAFTDSGADSMLQFTVGGTATQGTQSPGILQVTGAATVAGSLVVTLTPGAALPGGGDSLVILSAGSPISGSFAKAANGARLATSDGQGSFLVSHGAGSGAPNQVTLSQFLLPGQVEPTLPSVSFVVPGSDGGKSTTVAEGGPKLKILLTRTGDTTQPLTVTYKATSSAVPSTDYKPLSGIATIPAGATSTKLKIKTYDDGVADGTKVLKLKITGSGTTYTLGAVPTAKVTILDAEGGQ